MIPEERSRAVLSDLLSGIIFQMNLGLVRENENHACSEILERALAAGSRAIAGDNHFFSHLLSRGSVSLLIDQSAPTVLLLIDPSVVQIPFDNLFVFGLDQEESIRPGDDQVNFPKRSAFLQLDVMRKPIAFRQSLSKMLPDLIFKLISLGAG